MNWFTRKKKSLKNETLKRKPFQRFRNRYTNFKSRLFNYFERKNNRTTQPIDESRSKMRAFQNKVENTRFLKELIKQWCEKHKDKKSAILSDDKVKKIYNEYRCNSYLDRNLSPNNLANLSKVNTEAIKIPVGNTNTSNLNNLVLEPLTSTPKPLTPKPLTPTKKNININLSKAIPYEPLPITKESGERTLLTTNEAENWVRKVAKKPSRKNRITKMQQPGVMFYQPTLKQPYAIQQWRGGKKTKKVKRSTRKH